MNRDVPPALGVHARPRGCSCEPRERLRPHRRERDAVGAGEARGRRRERLAPTQEREKEEGRVDLQCRREPDQTAGERVPAFPVRAPGRDGQGEEQQVPLALRELLLERAAHEHEEQRGSDGEAQGSQQGQEDQRQRPEPQQVPDRERGSRAEAGEGHGDQDRGGRVRVHRELGDGGSLPAECAAEITVGRPPLERLARRRPVLEPVRLERISPRQRGRRHQRQGEEQGGGGAQPDHPGIGSYRRREG